MPTSARVCVVFWVAFLGQLGSAAQTQRVQLVSKCCPAGERLNYWINNCVSHLSEGMQLKKPETVTEAQQQFSGPVEFPAWVDNRTTLYDPETNEALPGEKAFLWFASGSPGPRFGQWPCEYPFSQYVRSAQRHRYKVFANGTLQLRVFKMNAGDTKPHQHEILLSSEEWCSDSYEPLEPGSLESGPRFSLIVCPCRQVVCVRNCCSDKRQHRLYLEGGEVSATCEETSFVGDQRSAIPTFYEGRCRVAGPTPLLATGPMNITDTAHVAVRDGCAAEPIAAISIFDNSTADSTECKVPWNTSVIYTQMYTHLPVCAEGYSRVHLNPSPMESGKKLLRAWLQLDGRVLLEGVDQQPVEGRQVCLTQAQLDEPNVQVMDSAYFCLSNYEPMEFKNYLYRC